VRLVIEKKVQFSFSDVKYFFECPYQFELRVLYGLNAPPSARSGTAREAAPAASLPNLIDAPLPAPGGGQVQEHEAIERGQLTGVQDREDASRGVRHPVGDGHLPGQEEGHRPGEETEEEQGTAEQFQDAGQPE